MYHAVWHGSEMLIIRAIMKKGLLVMAMLCCAVAVARADAPVKPREQINTGLQQLLQSPVTATNEHAQILFDHLTLDETLMARDILLAAKPSTNWEIAIGVLLQHWARLDGPSAYDFAQSQQAISKVNAISNVLYGWAWSDPAKAWDELMLISNRGADRRFSLMDAFDVIGAKNLDLALQLYEDLLPDRSCLKCCASRLLIAASQTGDFDKIFRQLGRMPAGPTRDALRDEYWEYFGHYMPEWALRNLKTMTDPADLKAAETNFCIGWAYTRFDDCMDYILKQAPSRRDELILVAVQAWAKHTMQGEVSRFVKTLPADLSERSLLGLATSLASIDPQVTLEWLKKFTSSRMRTEALGRAMTRWAKIDHEAAHQFINAGEEIETRGILLWYYLLAKLSNHTLDFSELDEIDARYSLAWRVSLFEEMAIELADPSINNGGKYDLTAFSAKVEARTDFSPADRMKILLPLKRR
jgi:hypothetical protein